MGFALSVRQREVMLGFDPAGVESVVGFCHRVGVSTSSFYRVRALALTGGQGAGLVARSRAPIRPARIYDGLTDALIAQARERLGQEGKENGPWSIWWQLFLAKVVPLPSRATIARRLRALGLVKPSPGKRPRASYRRFQAGRRNELWQLDGVEYRLQGQLVTIYQIIDDASRMMVGLLGLSGGETHAGAKAVLQASFDAYGKPATVLTDNARAFNQHRFGAISATEAWLARQGIRPISGQFGHPQTQGKIERAHQSLRAWLAVRTVTSLTELNTELDHYRHYYNHHRQHQGVKIGWTPAMVWDGLDQTGPADQPVPDEMILGCRTRALPVLTEPDLVTTITVKANGWAYYHGRVLNFGRPATGRHFHVLPGPNHIDIFDANGETYAHIPWPQPTPKRALINLTRPPFKLSQIS